MFTYSHFTIFARYRISISKYLMSYMLFYKHSTFLGQHQYAYGFLILALYSACNMLEIVGYHKSRYINVRLTLQHFMCFHFETLSKIYTRYTTFFSKNNFVLIVCFFFIYFGNFDVFPHMPTALFSGHFCYRKMVVKTQSWIEF